MESFAVKLSDCLENLAAQLRKNANRTASKIDTGTVSGATEKALKENSPYGRISMHTYSLFSSQAQYIVEPLLSYLPLDIDRDLRNWTLRKTLEIVYRDWQENGNLDPLEPEDISDLGSFAELAMQFARNEDGTSVPGDPVPLTAEQRAVYRATLSALHSDWLWNWNAKGASGPG